MKINLNLIVTAITFFSLFGSASGQSNLTTASALFFSQSGNAPDGLPWARFNENWGIRFNSPDSRWVFSSKPSVLIGFIPTGQDWGNDNILVAGKMGVGTTAPSGKVDVHGASPNSTNMVLSANYIDRYRWRLNTADRGNAIDLDFTSSDNLDAQEVVLSLTRSTSGRPEFKLYNDAIVANNGSVGIGTSNPGARLHVLDGGFRHGGIGEINIDANGIIGGRFKILDNGNVGIGTTSPDAKLAVKGNIHTQEVKVDLLGSVAPDYVFEKDYPLTSLEELKSYIDQNKHLPEIPSAKEMEENGINLKEMNLLLLKKVEELTLHLIQKEEEMKSIIVELEKLKKVVYEK